MKGPTLSAALIALVVAGGVSAAGHDRETTSVTWTRTVSRIVHQRCGSCHRPEGSSFSLMTYDDARPWAVAIRDEILARTMPPWGAVKGFGEFRNDNALSPSQMNLIISWVEGGVPVGSDADAAPEPEYAITAPPASEPGQILATGTTTLDAGLVLDGLWPREVPEDRSIQITAELPGGTVVPLLWLYRYRTDYGHPFLLKKPLELPSGSVIRGIPEDTSIVLLPLAPQPPD